MAKSVANFHFFLVFFLLFISILTCTTVKASENYEDNNTFFFVKSMDPKSITGNSQPEKLTHFRFYFHDIMSGKSPSSIIVVQPPKNTNNLFGLIDIIDDPLTVGPEISSKLVGYTQGLYASTSQEADIAVLMNMNLVFIEGKYNGSTITVTGRNQILHTVREMPVIGGSGVFRFARGYAQAKTYSYDSKTGDAVVEYNVYVFHN